jgi:hypothetical protein
MLVWGLFLGDILGILNMSVFWHIETGFQRDSILIWILFLEDIFRLCQSWTRSDYPATTAVIIVQFCMIVGTDFFLFEWCLSIMTHNKFHFNLKMETKYQRTGRSKGSVLELYPGDSWIEIRRRLRLSWLRILWFFSIPPSNAMIVPRFRCDAFQFIIHLSSYRPKLYRPGTEIVVK